MIQSWMDVFWGVCLGVAAMLILAWRLGGAEDSEYGYWEEEEEKEEGE